MTRRYPELYRKPDGNNTADTDEYIDSWRDLAQPFQDKLGWRLLGFDPSFTFVLPSDSTLVLTVEVVQQLRPFLVDTLPKKENK